VISIHRLEVAASRWKKENKAKRYIILNAADRGTRFGLIPESKF